ncbi:MAG: hypothetical protein AAB114_00935, partial [Chloroflexota bacterium]
MDGLGSILYGAVAGLAVGLFLSRLRYEGTDAFRGGVGFWRWFLRDVGTADRLAGLALALTYVIGLVYVVEVP